MADQAKFIEEGSYYILLQNLSTVSTFILKIWWPIEWKIKGV